MKPTVESVYINILDNNANYKKTNIFIQHCKIQIRILRLIGSTILSQKETYE